MKRKKKAWKKGPKPSPNPQLAYAKSLAFKIAWDWNINALSAMYPTIEHLVIQMKLEGATDEQVRRRVGYKIARWNILR